MGKLELELYYWRLDEQDVIVNTVAFEILSTVSSKG